MAFWSDPNTEPKRKYRWLLYMGGVPTWLIKKVGKPKFKVTESSHQYINHTFYYPGRVEWDPLDVTLVDPIAPDAAATVRDIITAAGYHFPVDPNDTSTMSKAKAVAALGNVEIKQLGAEQDEIVESWRLVNAWVSNVDLGDLDYSSDDMNEIVLTIRFDYAELVTSGEPVEIG